MKYFALSLLTTLPLAAVSEMQMQNMDKRLSKLERHVHRLDENSSPLGVDAAEDDLSVMFSGDLLYWYAEESGLAYALRTETNANLVDLPKRVEHVRFRFQPGFRVGFGFNTAHDNWNINLDWTYFDGSARQSTSLGQITTAEGAKQVYNSWNGTFAPYQGNFGYGRFDINFNQVDLEMKKEFWIGKYTSVVPHMGARAARIDTDYKVHVYGQFSTTETFWDDVVKYSQTQKGGGIVAGLDGNWYVNKYFSFFGGAACSLMFTENNIKKTETQTNVMTTLAQDYVATSQVYTTQPILDMTLGMKVEAMPVDSLLVGFSLAWEAHSFINYNQLFKIMDVANEGLISEVNGSLSMQGGVARLFVAF